MELSYELLWRACTWFLLCFLVTRLVSLVLITPPNSYDSVSGSVKDSRFKRTVDDGDHQKKKRKKKRSVLDNDASRRDVAGDRLKFHDPNSKSPSQRVHFDEKFVGFVKDIQVDSSGDKVNLVENDHDHGDLGKDLVMNEGISQDFEMNKVVFDAYGKSGEFGKELIDKTVEEKKEFDDRGGRKLESGLDIIADSGSNKILDCVTNVVVNEGFVRFRGGGEEHVLNEEGEGGGNGVKDEQTREASSSNVDREDEVRVVGKDVGVVDQTQEGVVGVGYAEEFRVDSGLGNGRIEDAGDPNDEGMSNVCAEGELSDEDEWEGIERSDIDKKFAMAVDFVKREEVEGRLGKLGREFVMQLYALEKIAIEGPCHEPQPMAIMLSARARWNAWQKLGSMSPEEAMEQYIILLSDSIPEWKEGHSSWSA